MVETLWRSLRTLGLPFLASSARSADAESRCSMYDSGPVVQPPSIIHMLEQQNIHIAAALGRLAPLDNCIRAGADINVRDLLGRSPLFTTAMHGFLAI